MSALRVASVWVVAFILAIVITAFLTAVTATQLTSDETGTRILRRSIAVTTDIDAVLPEIQAQLHEQAAETDAATVKVPVFPISVELPRDEAMTLEGAALRARILDQASDRVYDDGMSAWTSDDPGASQDIDRLSPAGLLNESLGLISGSNHTIFLVIAILLGVLMLAMSALLMLALPWDARLIAFGGIGLLASLPPLAAAVAVRFAFRTAGAGDDPFVDGLLDLGADSMWVPIRTFFTLAALSLVVLAIGSAYIWWESRNATISGHTAHTDF